MLDSPNRRTSCAPTEGIVTRAPPLRKDELYRKALRLPMAGRPVRGKGITTGFQPPPDERRRLGTDVKTPVQEPTPVGGGGRRAVAQVRRGWGKLPKTISFR